MATPRFDITQEVLDKLTMLGDAEDLLCLDELTNIVQGINRADDAFELAMIESFKKRRYFDVWKHISDNKVEVSQKGCSSILINLAY